MSTPLPPDLVALTLAAAASTITSLSPSSTLSAPTAPTASPTSSPSEPESGKCELLGPFAILVQAALGGLALLSLVYKRWRERPQRPVKIWAFDVSKQVVGSVLLHVANLLLSMISSGDLESGRSKGYKSNPCSFYLLNLAIDTTLGIPILILFLKIITILASKTPLGEPPESIKTGYYGDPPKVRWWIKQSFLYFIGLICMKLVVAVIIQILPWIVYVGDWALKWTEGNEQLQIFFVMLFFPLVMNALQYYIIDGFIKGKKGDDHEALKQDEEEDDAEERSRAHAWNSSFASDDEDGLQKPQSNSRNGKAVDKNSIPKIKIHEEYNPEHDGEGSISSQKKQARKAREQAPHE